MKSIIFVNEGMTWEMTKMKEQTSSYTGEMHLAKKIILKKSLDYTIFFCHDWNAFSLEKCFCEDNFGNNL